MKLPSRWSAIVLIASVIPSHLPAQQPAAVKTTVEEVVLDLVVRDKKGKPITDLKPDELTISDNGSKQTVKSFRLVRGSEAVSVTGTATKLDPLRQLRLVTLAFEPLGAPDQRKMAREAALDLIKGAQGTNEYYSVVDINTRLLVLQPFTNDKDKLAQAIDRATAGQSVSKLASESDSIRDELKRQLSPDMASGESSAQSLTAAAVQAAAQNTSNGPPADPTKGILIRVMLDMLRMESAAAAQDTRLSLGALKALVVGLQPMPGRKSILYFTQGMYLSPELDVPFRNVISLANRANVTFYSVDTRGVMTFSQNAGAAGGLRGAAGASATTILRTGGAVTKDEVMSSDNAEASGRTNVQLPLRDLAESTGGFLIGDSNDLRSPLRHVNEEISSYYEVTYNPNIQNYDGTFRKISVSGDRKDLVIHARNGYFALPPDVRAAGLESFEMPILKAISEGKVSEDVPFHTGAIVLQPKEGGREVSLVVELPLRGLQPKIDPAKKTSNVHCSIAALIKDDKGEVVDKVSRDRSFQVTADQLKMGNFVEKSELTVPPGKYTLESAVMDRETGKVGMQRAEFEVPGQHKGVGISSLASIRSYVPNVKNLDPAEPFQFQGGTITLTLNHSVPRAKDSALRLFFTIYQDAAIAAKPTVEVEFNQNGKTLQKAPLPLPAADALGRIQYVMTIPAAAIPPGTYEIRATAKQGDTADSSMTTVTIEAQ